MAALSIVRFTCSGAAAQLAVTVLQDLLPALALLLGIRLYRPRRPLAWRLLAAGQLCFGVGDVTYYFYLDVLHVDPPLPYSGDVWYLAMYPLLAAGLLVLVKGRTPGRDAAGLLDALLVTVGVGMLTWGFLIDRYLEAGQLSLPAQVASAGYPLMDVLLLAVVARLLFDRGPRPVSFYLLAGGVLPLLLSDTGYAIGRATGTFETGGVIELGWVLYYICLGGAALHPSMTRLDEPAPASVIRLSGLRFGVLTALPALSIALVVTLTDMLKEPSGPRLLIGGSVLLWMLTVLRVTGVIRLLRQTTEQNEELHRHQTFHDSLTGLANRALFVDRVHHAMARRSLADAPLAVLVLDLDDFKTVNDSLGHDIGDELLVAVAGRLRVSLRPSDTPARLGGDEFAVLLEDLGSAAEATAVAERILSALHAPFRLAEQEVTGRASVGIALVDLDVIPRAEDLLRDAEAAMYAAKTRHRGGYAVFTPSMHAAMVRKLTLAAELRSALGHDQFVVYYQPIVGLAEGRIVGVEALVRWQHPCRGLVGPVEFIPLAEEIGLIVPLGRWVLQQACAEGVRWHRAGWAPLSVAVNVSLRQMQDPAFTGEVAAILAAAGLPPGSLTLEITESFLAEEGDSMIQQLWALKALGVRLAIDDFGTGYSSLSRLLNFPIDILKIPKPFVDGILDGGDQAALARTITDLARTLRMDVVAEGIEHREQWNELQRMACQYGQGYFFARPMPAAEIDELLRLGQLTGPARPAQHAHTLPG
jgi:diguanylate cyclase (GGDEF)-like protein